MFYERPAAPYATGKCIYFRNEDRLLKAHPLSELRRIYEEVNNIRILSDTNKRPLTLEERDKIINELLLQGENAGSKSIKKLLKLSAQQKISIDGDKDKPSTVIDNLTMMTHKHYDLVLTAHLHHFSCDEKNETVVVSNGSLMGTDAYAEKLRLSSKPSQNLIIVSEDNVVDEIHRIVVG